MGLSWWDWTKKYILNIDTIVVIFIFAIVIYFILSRERKTYEFKGVEGKNLKFRVIKEKKKKQPRFNKHEEECRRIFQEIFGVRFKSIRPAWLKNPITKKNLELDGFNSTIETPLGNSLAFEYNGSQHAKYNPFFHKNGVEEFKYQVTKDSWKNKKCKERGVLLINIPHFVGFTDLNRYIRTELKRYGVIIPNRSRFYTNNIPIEADEIYKI